MALRAVRRATFLSKAAALKAGNAGRVTERATGLVPRATERVSEEYLGMVMGDEVEVGVRARAGGERGDGGGSRRWGGAGLFWAVGCRRGEGKGWGWWEGKVARGNTAMASTTAKREGRGNCSSSWGIQPIGTRILGLGRFRKGGGVRERARKWVQWVGRRAWLSLAVGLC
eukprot:scaffold1525_cov96-Amphora_coffeaeformis.AAC.1